MRADGGKENAGKRDLTAKTPRPPRSERGGIGIDFRNLT
jgi:hypothetical protein